MIEFISSPANTLIKEITSLKQKKYRDELGMFIAEGVRLVEESTAVGWPIEVCVYTEAAVSRERARKIVNKLVSANCRMVQVPDEVYNKLSDTEQPQGLMAILKKYPTTINQMVNNEKVTLIAVLDGIQDPGNAGTIIRTADAAGCTGVIMLKGSVDIYSGKTVRATMGSLFHLPVVEGLTAKELIQAIDDNGIKLISTSLEKSHVYYQADFRQPVAIVFGNEGQGVSQDLIEAASARLHIPLIGQAESLNVAVAAGVILYEALRQRSTL